MNEYMVALQGNGENAMQVFYVLCASMDEAIDLTKNAKGALSGAKVIVAGPVKGSAGLNLQPNKPLQWI